jgi:hypothetical protein
MEDSRIVRLIGKTTAGVATFWCRDELRADWDGTRDLRRVEPRQGSIVFSVHQSADPH